MRPFLQLLAGGALLLLVSSAAKAQVIFNDNFNNTDSPTHHVFINTGTGDVNPTGASTTAFGTDSGGTSPTEPTTGAYFAPSGAYAANRIHSVTGNNTGNTAYTLSTSGPTQFAFTVNNVTVTSNQTNGNSGLPDAGDAGFRFELGLYSANFSTTADPEFYNQNKGGIYLSLFYDQSGNLTGNLVASDHTKGSGTNTVPGTGAYLLAEFTIGQPAGTTSSYTTPLTADFNLTSTGYAVSFNEAVTVTEGSLSGTDPGLLATDLSAGVRESLMGQNIGVVTTGGFGAGTGYITDDVVTIPEPRTFGLIGLGLLGLAGLSHWRSRRLA